MNFELTASMMCANYGNLGKEVRDLEKAGIDSFHIDIMDGRYVPNYAMSLNDMRYIASATDKPLDVHLMIEEPIRYIDEFVEAGADIITVHAEACKHLDRTIAAIKERGVLAGVALNPATPIETIRYVLPKVDMVLIMTVNPGFGGQKLIPYTLDKVKELKALLNREKLKVDIEVDGGINLSNVEEAMDAGANIIVAGSAVFKGDIEQNVTGFLDVMQNTL